VRSINWAKFTLNHLLESIVRFKQGKANLEGNLPLLQFSASNAFVYMLDVSFFCLLQILALYYWEKLRFNNIYSTLDYTEREVPLMQYWNEQKVRRVNDEQFNFGAGIIICLPKSCILAINMLC
jgi:hypothetical protein